MKPRLAESANNLYEEFVRLSNEGVVGEWGVAYPTAIVIGDKSYCMLHGELHVSQGIGVIKATPAQAEDFHHSIDMDVVRIVIIRHGKITSVLHEPSGLYWYKSEMWTRGYENAAMQFACIPDFKNVKEKTDYEAGLAWGYKKNGR